jgi:flagellar motor protein MotB
VFVTFADLMGLLASFFVMLVAFSTQDQAKLQVVAGSMRMRSLSRIVSVIPALTGLAGHAGISEASKHIMLEETKQSLNVEIVDQDGRSIDAAKEPFKRTRKLIQKIAPQLKAMPYRLSTVGHTASSKVPPKPGYSLWGLTIAPMPSARFWMRKAFRENIDMVGGRPTPICFFLTTPICRRTGVSRSS